MLKIRRANDSDHDAIWEIFHEVVAAGDTYPFDPEMSREDALAYWFQKGAHTYVAEQDRHILGSYILRPNWSGLAGHVANAAFIVAATARGLVRRARADTGEQRQPAGFTITCAVVGPSTSLFPCPVAAAPPRHLR